VSLEDAPERGAAYRERFGLWYYPLAALVFVPVVLVVLGCGVWFIVHMFRSFSNGLRDG
jgi:hypothetical protein